MAVVMFEFIYNSWEWLLVACIIGLFVNYCIPEKWLLSKNQKYVNSKLNIFRLSEFYANTKNSVPDMLSASIKLSSNEVPATIKKLLPTISADEVSNIVNNNEVIKQIFSIEIHIAFKESILHFYILGNPSFNKDDIFKYIELDEHFNNKQIIFSNKALMYEYLFPQQT